MPRTIPAWLWCFIATLVVFLLQVPPFPGIYLMVLAAPLWSAALINLGFILMTRDVVMGQLPRVAILAPIAWFGGYAVVAAISQWQAAQFLRGIETYNRHPPLRVDWGSHDLLFDLSWRYEGYLAGDSFGFIERHGMTQVFSRMAGLDLATRTEEYSYTASRLLSRRCPDFAAVKAINPDAVTLYARSPETSEKRSFRGWRVAENLCLWRDRGQPERATVRVAIGAPQVSRSALLETRVQDIRIVSPEGAVFQARAGTASPLGWFPLPVIGCALNSGQPSWKCFASFNPEGRKGGETHGEEAVITAALGLPNVTLEQRFPQAGWH